MRSAFASIKLGESRQQTIALEAIRTPPDRLERSTSSGDGAPHVVVRRLRNGCPGFLQVGVDCGKALAASTLDPLAIDIQLIFRAHRIL
jgi:hypothetical protein